MRHSALRTAVVVGILVLYLPALAAAQASKSEAVAKELVTAMEAKKLDSVAAKLPGEPDRFAAALYFPGVQLLVICGKYAQPVLLEPRIAKKEYRDIYMELNGTVARATRIFVSDMGAPGLAMKKTDGRFDTWSNGDVQVVFDGEPDKQKISEADYQKTFAAADEEYAKIVGALLAEAKK